jgi:hypothetical protein
MQVLVLVRFRETVRFTPSVFGFLERERERENTLTCSFRNFPYSFVVGSKEVSKGKH